MALFSISFWNCTSRGSCLRDWHWCCLTLSFCQRGTAPWFYQLVQIHASLIHFLCLFEACSTRGGSWTKTHSGVFAKIVFYSAVNTYLVGQILLNWNWIVLCLDFLTTFSCIFARVVSSEWAVAGPCRIWQSGLVWNHFACCFLIALMLFVVLWRIQGVIYPWWVGRLWCDSPAPHAAPPRPPSDLSSKTANSARVHSTDWFGRVFCLEICHVTLSIVGCCCLHGLLHAWIVWPPTALKKLHLEYFLPVIVWARRQSQLQIADTAWAHLSLGNQYQDWTRSSVLRCHLNKGYPSCQCPASGSKSCLNYFRHYFTGFSIGFALTFIIQVAFIGHASLSRPASSTPSASFSPNWFQFLVWRLSVAAFRIWKPSPAPSPASPS